MRNPAPIWSRLLYDPGRLATLQYTHVQPRRGAAACRLLEAPQPPPLALVITHETPDRFTACRGSFMSICLYALTAPQSRPGRAQAVRGYTYTMTGRKALRGAQRGAEGRRASTPAPRPQSSTTGGGWSVPVPHLESMVKPRSRGRQQAGRGCRPSAPSVTFEISLSALLPLLGFLRFL